MIFRIDFILCIFLSFALQALDARSLAEQFEQTGYAEICNRKHGTATFDSLYQCFDELVEFLQTHPVWEKKLYCAKEGFIRSKEKNYYSTDFFGFYDESKKEGRNQVSFYYSTHFHRFICSRYPEFNRVPEIIRFLETCFDIQASYENLFVEAATELGVETIFSSKYNRPPILFKVIKYFPFYVAVKPHYDGTVFSLFLDSTDNESLLLSAYRPSLTTGDFFSPPRQFSRDREKNSILLIPGVLLKEFNVNPTPHIVATSEKIRFATIAFAMRPDHIPRKEELTLLPDFKPGAFSTRNAIKN